MKVPVLTSEHRVGSRWLHYMLADILKMDVSPELDGKKATEFRGKARDFMKSRKIVKYHHGTPSDIIEGLNLPRDYGIIGMVRNPRDRGVSRAFHDFYHKKHDYRVKNEADNDFEAVRWVVTKSPPFMLDNWRQIDELMLDGYSTRNKYKTELPYIWTSYEWMKDDVYREVSKIIEFLGVTTSPEFLRKMINIHSFKNRSGRNPGEENRQNTWRRKGMMLDWINWFDTEMTEYTREVQEVYWAKLIKNGRLEI